MSVSGTISAMTASATNQTSPSPFDETAIGISDLKVGDAITAEAAEDIKMAASFEAVKISLTASAVIPGTAPAVNTPAPSER